MNSWAQARGPVIDIRLGGGVPEGAAAYAARTVRALAHDLRVPIHHAEVTLLRSSAPGSALPAVITETLDVAGREVRVRFVCGTFEEAIDRADRRARTRLGGPALRSRRKRSTRSARAAAPEVTAHP